MSKIILEADGPFNRNPMFHPLERALRSRIRWERIKDGNASQLMGKFAEWKIDSIPGEVLEIDPINMELVVVEPLYAEEYRAFRKGFIEGKKMMLQQPRQVTKIRDKEHLATCLFWAKRIVETGLGRLVPGSAEIPKDLGGGKPKLNLRHPTAESEEQKEQREMVKRQQDTIDRQQRQIDELLVALRGYLPAPKGK